jgi:DNA polymerase-1
MIKVHEWLPASGYDAKLLIPVHDELILEVREDQAETFGVELKTQMQCAAALNVPLIVDVGIGDNWE